MIADGCTGLNALNPVCQIGSLGGSLASSGFQAALNDISQWVASGAEYLLSQIGDVLVSTTSIDIGASWFRAHYGAMTALAGVVILPMLLVSTLQAILRQNPGQLIRTYLLQLPAALLLAGVAIQVVILSLSATDAMSNAIAGGTGSDVTSLLSGITRGLTGAAADPALASFVLLLIALLIAVAAFVLWVELLIRAAAVYVAVLFLPIALAALVWPAVSHWCRRLVETLAALILSKFVIVATLSLATGAISSGTAGSGNHGAGFSAVLAGGTLLMMATFVPFAIMRMIPMIEAGAIGHLDGLRQRGTSAVSRPLKSAAGFALNAGLEAMGDARLLAQTAADGAAMKGAAMFGMSDEDWSDTSHERGDTVVGPNGETVDELNAMATVENGGLIARADGRGVGLAESQQLWDDFASGRKTPTPLRPKGPKPIIPAKTQGATTSETSPSTSPTPDSEDWPVAGEDWHPKWAGRMPYEPGLSGPAGPEDAWKWVGIPKGSGRLGPIEPGKRRNFLITDETGKPRFKTFPPAWPPGEGPDADPSTTGS
jgi:hypothetical protein